MECPVCGYHMDPLDQQCPRCAHMGMSGRTPSGSQLPSGVPIAGSSRIARFIDSLKNDLQQCQESLPGQPLLMQLAVGFLTLVALLDILNLLTSLGSNLLGSLLLIVREVGFICYLTRRRISMALYGVMALLGMVLFMARHHVYYSPADQHFDWYIQFLLLGFPLFVVLASWWTWEKSADRITITVSDMQEKAPMVPEPPASWQQRWAKVLAIMTLVINAQSLIACMLLWFFGYILVTAGSSEPTFADLLKSPLPFIIIVSPILNLLEVIIGIGILKRQRWGAYISVVGLLLAIGINIKFLQIVYSVTGGKGVSVLPLILCLPSLLLSVAPVYVFLKAAEEWE